MVGRTLSAKRHEPTSSRVELPPPLDAIADRVGALVEASVGEVVNGIGLILGRETEQVMIGGRAEGSEHRIAIKESGTKAQVIVYASPGAALDRELVRVELEWRSLIGLACRDSELAGLTAGLVEANDQLLSLYELSSSWASSLSPDELGAFATEVAVSVTGCEAALLTDVAGREFVAGDAARISHLQKCVSRAEGNAAIFRTGDRGLPSDVVVAQLDGDHPAALAFGAPIGRRLTTPTRKLIEAVASHVGGLVTLSGFHEAQLEMAVVQRDIETAGLLSDQVMPAWTPSVEGIELAARSDYARLASGDFYTYVETPYGLLAAVGDVSGKGLPAALVMTMVSSATKAAAHRHGDPDPLAVLNSVSHDVYDYLSEAGVFVTMTVATWDVETRLLTVGNAGHSPVLLVDRTGLHQIPAADPPLGILETLSGEPQTIEMALGDALLIGSDGLAEQENKEGTQLGYAGVEATLAKAGSMSAADVVADMFAMVESHGEGVPQDDDRTALVVKRVAP